MRTFQREYISGNTTGGIDHAVRTRRQSFKQALPGYFPRRVFPPRLFLQETKLRLSGQRVRIKNRKCMTESGPGRFHD